MINEINMWSAECDGCKRIYQIFDGIIALDDKSAIFSDIQDSNEWVVLDNGKVYCEDCHSSCWNEETDENEAFGTHEGKTNLLGIIQD